MPKLDQPKHFAATDDSLGEMFDALTSQVGYAKAACGATSPELASHPFLQLLLLTAHRNYVLQMPDNNFPTFDPQLEASIPTYSMGLAGMARAHADIQDAVKSGTHNSTDVLALLARSLSDIILSALSEARKYGIPLSPVLDVVLSAKFGDVDPMPIVADLLLEFSELEESFLPDTVTPSQRMRLH